MESFFRLDGKEIKFNLPFADFLHNYPDDLRCQLLYVIDYYDETTKVYLLRFSEVAPTFLLNKELFTSAYLFRFLEERGLYSGLHQLIMNLESTEDIKNEVITLIFYFLTTDEQISVDLLAAMFTDSGIKYESAFELANTVYFRGIDIPEGEITEALRTGSQFAETEETNDATGIFKPGEVIAILQNKSSVNFIYDNYIFHRYDFGILIECNEAVNVAHVKETAYLVEDHERLILGFGCRLMNVLSLCMLSSPLLYNFIVSKTSLTERSCLSLGSFIRLNINDIITFEKSNDQNLSVGSFITENQLIKSNLESILNQQEGKNYFPVFLDVSKGN